MSPLYVLWRLVVVPDVLHEFSALVGQRCEHATGNDVTLDLGKPELDLVEPRRVSRGEMQVNLGMSCQKVVDLTGLMSRSYPQSRGFLCRGVG